MIDRKDFASLQKKVKDFDERRENLIKASRDMLRLSKKAIYSIHRKETKQAGKLISEVEKCMKGIKKETSGMPKLDFIGAYSAAVQEYVEAKCYYGYATEKKIPKWSDLKVDPEDYLMGLCDLTGELARRAVMSVIENDLQEVYVIRDLVSEIFRLFLELDLRNSELRKKSDAIKWNLRKIEDIIYDIKTRGITDEPC